MTTPRDDLLSRIAQEEARLASLDEQREEVDSTPEGEPHRSRRYPLTQKDQAVRLRPGVRQQVRAGRVRAAQDQVRVETIAEEATRWGQAIRVRLAEPDDGVIAASVLDTQMDTALMRDLSSPSFPSLVTR